MNQFLSKVNRFVIALIGVLVLGISSVFAGTAYTNGRAFLKQGSPTGGGKVYVASNATEPTSGQYKAVTSSTSPAFNVQVDGNATFHYWAVANAGYIFTGWYTAEGALQSSGAAHISKAVTAGTAGTSDTHAYADFYASFIKQIQLSFVVPTNGSFTITHKGSEVTPAYSSFTTEGKVVLTALPADGYKLRGWYTTTNGGVTKNYFAFGNSCEPNFTSNTTIGAEFVPDDGKATFWIKGTNFIYDNLTDANTKAASVSSKMIVVVSDGVVGAGTYTISSGVTLLIPYEETYTLMTKPNIKHIPSPNAASKVTSIFRKLTLASGATVNVSGNICIGGSIASCNGGSPSSFPTGPVGMLDLSRGGTINLASGSNLYAWGYVKGQDMDQGNNTAASGVGEINAASGATVWEDYQVGEWRGGTASSTIYNNKGSWKFFPFQSYTIQNIEAPVNYVYGSNLKCFWTIFGNGSVYDVNFPLIASSGSLFKLASGGTVRKWYDPTIDHVCFELGGTAALDALTLSVMGETVSSSDYYLPIPANLKIILKSGNSLTVSKPMTMHAGSVVEVKSGATLNVNNRVHLFDADDWDTYCMYAYYYRTYYSPSLHFNRGEGTAKTNLEDATVIVDGTVDVKGAYLYSSAHGSNICGNGGGTFKYAALPSNTTMTQCKVLKDNVSVNIRSANLHNDNGTYTKGIASTTFKNVNGRWFTNAKSTEKANHTYDFTYIKSGDVYGTGGTNTTVASCYSKDKTGLELQNKWANIKVEGCDNWWTGIDDSHLYNWTLNSAWHQYIKTGSTAGEEGEDPIETYAGSDGKIYTKQGCDITPEGTIDANCLYTVSGVKKALVNGSFIAVVKNTEDEAYHKSDAATTYYLCFDGCVWHPATKNAENLYTVDGTKYIWYGDKWMAVEYDSGVALHYSLSATNVKIYYDYVDHAWVLATPVAEVVTSAGTEQVFSLANAITKAKAGGTNVTIRLLKNISGTISYDGTNNCGLDLNGFTLSSSTSGMITVNSATATFIIKDQSAAGTGKVQLSYSANARRYAISVTKGHLVVNSGTISAINTMAYNSSSAKTVDVGAITVAAGHKVTVNGGTIEAISDHNPYGIYLAGATAMATINGGTIEAKTTERSSSVDSPYGIIGAGSIYVNGGTVKATCYRSSSSRGISSSGTFTMTGGSVIATASSTCYGVYAASGSNTTISGGTVTSTTTGGTARALISYATATVSGGTLTATAGGSDAKGIYVAGGTTTVNTGATVSASATTNAYGIYYADGTPTVTVNGGAFTVSTTSTTGAYGVYAAKGTGTINDGTFTVTAKTTGAEGMHVETANTPKLTLNGGKFMVKNSNGSANGTINNTGATLANFSMAGGYFNVAPNGTTNIAAGKSVKDVERAKEQAIYDAGYVKKIAGNEYTVTWKSFNGATTLGTSQVESGQVPVWTGERPDYKDATSEREWIGWATDTWNRGTKYVNGTPLPAIAASDVTYYAACQAIYADVTAGGTTTRYNSAQTAWTEAMKHKQATIRILTNLGSEANVGNMTELVFNPANEGSIITLDLNGHIWTMGNHSTAANNKNIFLNVTPSKANCKLIVTDNSASGNGYLMNKHDYAANLICAYVATGELILQGGGLKCCNTNATNNAIGVQTNGGVFTMTGGIVESKKDGDAVTSGTASGVYCYSNANLSGGTIRATNAKANAVGVYVFRNNASTVLEEGLTVEANAKTGAWTVHGYGTVDIQGGTYRATATTSNARGIYMVQSGTNLGQATVSGNPTFTVTAPTQAQGAYANGASGKNVFITIEGGTFSATATNGSTAAGVQADNYATATVKGGTFTATLTKADNGLTGSDKKNYDGCFGVYALSHGTMNVEGGTFNVQPALVGGNNDCARCYTYDDTKLNISGGTFTMTNGGYAVRAFGGTTHISGNPTFTARYGIDIGSWAAATGTATMVVDGGTFNATVGEAVRCYTTSTVKDAGKDTEHTDVVTGDLTIWDGKFHSPSSIKPVIVNSNTSTSNIKIRGGYYSSYTSSNVSNLTKYVVSPSTAEALASGTTEYTEGYRYRVNTKYNVTFSVNGSNTVKQYNRNETPSFGSTPAINDGNTYDFIGWTPEIAPVTTDATYTAVFKKWEAEIIMPNGTSKRYESFATAWTDAQQLQNCTLRLLSNVNSSVQLTYNPAPPAGTTTEDEAYFTNATTTLDLNNHTLAFTGTANDRFLVINKTGSKFIIDDSSAQKNGVIKYESTRDGMLICVATHYGDLELRGGTILARNNNATNTSVGVYPCRATTFTMTDGNIKAYARQSAKGVYTEAGGTEVVNISGGAILASTEYDNSGTPAWGNYSYGVHIRAGAKATLDGTYTVTSHANQDAYGIYAEGTSATAKGEITMKSGTVTAITNTKRVFGAWVNAYGTINIDGGTIDAHSTVANVTSMWNVEGAHCSGNGILNISGGDISSDNGASPIGVSVHGGKTTITGGKITSKTALHAVDYASATQTATIIVNGGTFIATDCAVRSSGLIRDSSIKNNANVTINGGYFYSTGSYIVHLRNDAGANPSTLVLNGGKYFEKSGTTFKNQINALKGATTTINDINETVDGKTYKYQLLTDFTVTWKAGTSYTKSETVRSGKTPSNTEVTSFVRNDSTFYFTGWTPTPSPVITDITYQAEGEYHVAKVKIGSGAWKIYDDFDEAWNDAMAATDATVNITLLNNVTLNDYLAYKPTIANARTTLDLNNFTLTQNSALYSIHINKADAKLTITDTSEDKGGCIYKKMSSSTSIYGVYVYNGEAIMAGGKIYCENTIDNTSWHPAGGLYNASASAKITVTGGTVEAAAQITAYAITGYGPVNVSGGLVKATVKKYNNARALSQQMNTATITGGTFEASSTGNATGIYAVMAGAWIGSTAASAQSATVNISGGKFKAQTASSSAVCAFADGMVKKIGEEIVTAHGTLTITGGEFTTLAPAATATQIFSVVSNGARLFDDDHNLIGESRAETTISGGTFLVDTRDNGAYVVNKNNNDILRCWGTINITGGTFTIYQNSGATGIGCYRGKVTISGNPVFNINGTTQTKGIIAGPWNHSSYCDKDATNNLAEIEVNGGTFNVTANGTDGNVIGAWTNGSISSTSATDAAALAGYAMSSKITINGGEFICSGQKLVRTFYQYGSVEGTYGTAKREIFVNGGKFKSQIATFNADGTINTVTGAGANVETGNASVKLAGLTGGYYSNNNHLEANRADTCDLITLEETDPEYANGYRYKIEPHYVAKVSKAGASDRFFCVMKDAFDYAKTQDNSTITLLRTVDDYAGSTLYYDPTTAKSCTLDLNGFTFKGQATSGEPDRLLIVSKGGCTFTIKDSSTGKTGKFSHEKSGAAFGIVVYHGTLVLESGTVHCKNTSGGAQALRSTGSDAIIQMTGGKAHAEATGTAYAVNSYGPATITGGLLLAEGADARGVNSQDANADVKVKGNAVIKAIASSGTAHGLYVEGGGKLTISENACDTAICTTKAARGAYVGNGQLTISGNATIRSNAGTASYTVLAQGSNANVTIEGGTITSYSSANSASITVYANLGATAHITGGTFYALCISGASNVSPIRTAGNNTTMTIDGGIFYGGESGTQFQAVSIRGGETTINGGTFTAATGIRAMDWADAATITGKLTVKGGTFNTTAQAIYVSSKANDSRNAHSEVTIEGGKFKTTGSTIVQMDAAPAGTTASTLIIAGGYFSEKSGTTFKNQITPFIADTSEINTLDPLYEGTYKYEVAPHYVASVKVNSTTTNYTILKNALDYARTQAASLVTILDDCDFETDGQYGYGLGTTGKTMTIDLNNHTVNATNSVTSYDRVFAVTGQITITDNSDAKGGKLNLTKAHNGTFLGVVFNDASQLTLANGTIYVENETASKAVEALNIWSTTSTFRQTGGTLQAKAISATATGVQMHGTAQISGGNITVTSEGGNARAFSQDADAGNSKYSSLTVSGTPTITVSGAGEVSGVYSNVAGTSTTISGGTWNITSTSTSAYGVRLTKANTATISGGTFNATATTTNAYGVYVSAGGSVTVSGGTFTSRNGAGQNECFGAFATGTGTTLDITGGTFDVNSANNAGGNINVVRVQPSATVTISGGTFRSGATSGYGLVAFGGVTTVSGTALFEAYTGAYAGSWYQGDGSSNVTATVNLNGGTFNVKGVAINATWGTQYKDGAYLASPFVNSIVNVNGGRYKTTGGTIVQKKADGADGGTAVLHIAGGYFNEKSGTTFKEQIEPYIADTSRINTLDPLLEGVYKYEVAPHYVAKVRESGGAEKYFTLVTSALDFFKTKNNATLTMLDNAELPAAPSRYTLTPTISNWRGTWDLNDKTVSCTYVASGYAMFDLNKADAILTITDNSIAKRGRLEHVESSASGAVWGLNIENGEIILEAGTIYSKNTNADATGSKVGMSVKNANSRFTMNGGRIECVGSTGSQGLVLSGGSAATVSGGKIISIAELNGTVGNYAYGIYISGTSTLTVNGADSIYAKGGKADDTRAYALNAGGGTVTIEGTPFIMAESPTKGARVLQSSGTANVTVNGGVFEAKAGTTDSYALIAEGTSTMTVNGGKYKTNQTNISYKSANATLTINGGYYNESSGTNHKTRVATYLGSGKVVLNLDTDDAEYAAGYRYVVTTDPVAKVKVGTTTTYYTTVAKAFAAASAATSVSTITMLKDASVTSQLRLGNADGRNCTLDLNGHTITSTSSEQYPLIVRTSGGSLTITDLTESKLGRLDITTNYTGTAKDKNPFGVYLYAGTLNLNAGTISVSCSTDTVYGIVAKASQTFTMNGGTLDVSATNMVGYGVNSSGTATIKNGTVQVAAKGKAYGIARSGSGGTFTVEDGKFNISSTSATAYATNKSTTDANLIIQGGWYTTKNRLATGVPAPYQVLSLAGQSPYLYEVAEAYTLTWATDGDALTGTYTSGTTKVGTSIVAPNTPTKTGYTFAAWTPAVEATMPANDVTYTATWTMDVVGDRLDIVDWTATDLTINANGWAASGWPYTINGTSYESSARAADRTLTIPYTGEAGTDLRITVESGGSIIRQHYYRIPFIGTTAGVTTADTIYVNSGTLAINASALTSIGGLYIRPEASVTITGGTLAIGKLVLRTLPWQAAAINGSFTAAETWYTRIAPNKRTITGPYAPITYESSSYYQFALPRNCTAKLKDVQVSHGANTPYGNTWLLKRYNEETRAANGTGEANWVVLDKEEYIQGGVGYEMSSNSNYYREFYFPLGAVNSASIGTTTAVSFHSGAAGVQHAGWNWVASPLMGVFDNSGADPETGMKIGWLLTDGSYDQGIPEYIYPAIPFSYQTSSGQSTISFAGSSIVASVPFRRVAAQEETVRLQWIHLDIQDTTGVGDHTSILAHPMRYDETYKPGIDVAKQSFTASRALLYSSHAYGEMAFAGVSDSLLMRGVPLTIYSPVAQELTISMRANNWLDRLDHVWLVDYETGVRTDLLIGDYTFDAAAGTTTARLVLEGQFKTPQIITGNEDVQDESTKPVKYIYQDKMYIKIDGVLYDATGKLVRK